MVAGLSQTRRKPIHGGLIAASLLLTLPEGDPGRLPEVMQQ